MSDKFRGFSRQRISKIFAWSALVYGALFVSCAIAAPKPDLVVQAIEGVSSPVYEGDPVPPLKTTVKNVGTASATPVVVTMSCEPMPPTLGHCPSTIMLGWSSSATPLAPGNTLTLPQWPSTTPPTWVTGKYRITATVDSKNQVAESNEGNNSKVLVVTVEKPVFEAYLKPKNYLGTCPVDDLDVVVGYIKAVHGGGLVKWQLITSWDDPAKTQYVYETNLVPGQTDPVSMKTATDKSVSGWTKVHFVSPTVKDSAAVNFAVNCLSDFSKKLKQKPLPVFPKSN